VWLIWSHIKETEALISSDYTLALLTHTSAGLTEVKVVSVCCTHCAFDLQLSHFLAESVHRGYYEDSLSSESAFTEPSEHI